MTNSQPASQPGSQRQKDTETESGRERETAGGREKAIVETVIALVKGPQRFVRRKALSHEALEDSP